jgi:hypothetical protein
VPNRLWHLLDQQRTTNFSGLSGSDVRAAIRISTSLLNEALALYVSSSAAVRELTVQPRAGNRFNVNLKVAKPLVPPINVTVVIERQPELPVDPTLVLHLTGIGGLMRFLAPAIASFASGLPPGIRLDGDRVFVDLLEVLRAYGEAELLPLAEEMAIGTDEGHVLVVVRARVP